MLVTVLTVAGSDSSGGAGVQADIKAISANGGYAASVITAVTAQNTQAVLAAEPVPLDLIAAQLDAVFADLPIAAVKTGMLANAAVVRRVAERLRHHNAPNLVVDPVMVSKSGYPLLDAEGVVAVREELIPLARLITPNAHEAALLSELPVRTVEEARRAAERLSSLGPAAVLVKGGHLEDTAEAVDVLWEGGKIHEFRAPRIPTRNTHGTGCTYSAAIATQLAHGRTLPEAVAQAKEYLTGAIRHAPGIGSGHGPLHHFWRYDPEVSP